MQSDERTLQLVEQVLQDFGLQSVRIPRSDTKTPDLLATDNSLSYLIEVKDKYPDPQELKRRSETLERGEVYESQSELSHHNSISSVISEGVEQFSTYDKPVDFRLLWLHARGLQPEAQLPQLAATLYGTVTISDRVKWSETEPKPCYFFYFNEFHLHKDIVDGAIISDDSQGRFCLNPYSPRYEALKQSSLYKAFAVQNGVCDLPAEEAVGDAFIADWEGTRKNTAETLARLCEKYGNPNLIDYVYTHASGEMRVPRNTEENTDSDDA